MNKYYLIELLATLENTLDELKDYRDDLKNSERDIDKYYAEQLTYVAKAINLNPFKRLVDSL